MRPLFVATAYSAVPFVAAVLGALIAFAFRDASFVLSTHGKSSGVVFPGSTKIINSFDWNLSTDEIYASPGEVLVGKYHYIRKSLDYSYHSVYSQPRQRLQDAIVDSILDHTNCSRPQNPWIVFTAGPMGAGKTHTVKTLGGKGYFPLDRFVLVDPDHVRRSLPEFETYVQHCPERAGERTRKEAGMVAEIAIEAGLQNGYNILVDGSMSNATWYERYFPTLRKAYPNVRIAILHVTAPREAVFQRALNRARQTGRVVPQGLLERTMEIVPRSVARLKSLVDFCVEIHNSGQDDATLVSGTMNWGTFQRQWTQKCLD